MEFLISHHVVWDTQIAYMKGQGKSFLGDKLSQRCKPKITAHGDCNHEIKRFLLPGRKAMANLDSILEIRGITLPTKVCRVKAMVFPVVMHGCEKETEVTQSCPTLCDPMDCSLPGSSVHGIFQAIVLEWIAISFSRGSS